MDEPDFDWQGCLLGMGALEVATLIRQLLQDHEAITGEIFRGALWAKRLLYNPRYPAKPTRKFGLFRSDEMKKRESTPPGEAAQANVTDDKFAKKFPSLWEYLTMLHYEDGSSRELSKVSIFVENGMIKAALNDQDTKSSLYASSDSVEGVFMSLNKLVASPDADWRVWKSGGKKK